MHHLLFPLMTGICAALLVALVVVSILYFGERKDGLAYPVRKWRIAISRRQEALRAERRGARAQAEAAAYARPLKEWAERHRARAQADAAAVKAYGGRLKHSAEQLRALTGERVAMMGSYIIAEQAGDHIKGIRANNYHAKRDKIQK